MISSLEQAKQILPLPNLLTHLGLGDHAKASARCPLHEDGNPSFGLYRNDKSEWAWKCHSGCGGGDGADFIAKLENISNPDACRRYIELAGVTTATDYPTVAKRSSTPVDTCTKRFERSLAPTEIYNPTDDDCAAAIKMAESLSTDLILCERIARGRKWRAETLQTLAFEGYLGWHDGKLAFIYDTGVKLRWREKGERIIRWAFGKPWIWRGAWLNTAQSVYLCESETDAISLIDAGIEQEVGVAVVAMPSASTFREDWVHLFSRKDVILAFDNDAAGAKATQRVSKLLRPHTRSLNRLNWEGTEHAA